ncbi:MAG: 50S ribosomal protein L28 [Proteobacteria bacterium]|nr:50S ribosomal protein L28 [Pseudomonadota bacterium]
MSRVCQTSQKSVLVGNRVSHSHIRTKHRFLPNLQKKRFYSESRKKFYTLRVATSTMRTIDKLGLDAYVRKVGYTLK